MPEEKALRGTNLNNVCPWITYAKWLGENCDVILVLRDSGLRFCRVLGQSGLFL